MCAITNSNVDTRLPDGGEETMVCNKEFEKTPRKRDHQRHSKASIAVF